MGRRRLSCSREERPPCCAKIQRSGETFCHQGAFDFAHKRQCLSSEAGLKIPPNSLNRLGILKPVSKVVEGV